MGEHRSIEDWKQEGKERGATHLVVVVGIKDQKTTHFFVMPGEDPEKAVEEVASSAVRCSAVAIEPVSSA